MKKYLHTGAHRIHCFALSANFVNGSYKGLFRFSLLEGLNSLGTKSAIPKNLKQGYVFLNIKDNSSG